LVFAVATPDIASATAPATICKERLVIDRLPNYMECMEKFGIRAPERGLSSGAGGIPPKTDVRMAAADGERMSIL
jgi:hypothetical protein